MPIYLDNAATSFPKPEVVYRASDEFMRKVDVNAGRGAYRQALEAGVGCSFMKELRNWPRIYLK
ncbi:hypothetical protein [Phosphitispora fastidiosa]|uniref:hypothetical protein n=1 Tax=Phosphitispora fastidiosa TaxID=2837202 RepID=UPI001E606BF3|nr:hypothetical protein [Phosphitispora fastidiosa]MBU7008064.1 selenocysteine lyase/cysteine desulfurase [Phosphitispora fastidiosa]